MPHNARGASLREKQNADTVNRAILRNNMDATRSGSRPAPGCSGKTKLQSRRPQGTATTNAKRDPNTMVGSKRHDQSDEAASAEMMAEGIGMNAVASARFSRTLGELDLTECMAALSTQSRQVQAGSLEKLETLLAAQAVTLNAMFTQTLYQVSSMTIVDQIDRFTRLALKAQSQFRATVETLALIKAGPLTVFARQANISSGAQQINNGGAASPVAPRVRARTEVQESRPIGLLEAQTHDERLDLGTPAEAGTRNTAVAALAALNRPKNRGREAT